METIYSLILLSFFMPFASGLLGVDQINSQVTSFEKIIMLGLLYPLALLMFTRRKEPFRKEALKYLMPAIIYFLFLTFNYYIDSAAATDSEMLSAKKEIFRLAFFIILIFFCAKVRMNTNSYFLMIYKLTFLGFSFGLLTLYSAMTHFSVRKQMVIGEFVRAGADYTATNNLAAALNVFSLSALFAFLIVKNRILKYLCLLSLIISQAGRFFTFSNGSLVSISVSFIIVVYLIRNIDKKKFYQILIISIITSGILIISMFISGKSDQIFSRMFEINVQGVPVSLYSRFPQYYGLWELIASEPLKLIVGVGTANVHSAIKSHQTLHNAYLLPLVSAGLGGFLSFLYLWSLSLKNYYFAYKNSLSSKNDAILTLFWLAAYIGYSVQILTVPYSLSTTTWFFFILSYSFSNFIRDKQALFFQDTQNFNTTPKV